MNMKEILLTATGLLSWVAIYFVIEYATKRNRKRIEEMKHVREEIRFMEKEYEKLFKQAHHCVDRDNWNAYRIVRERINNLDKRWEREVTRKLKSRP